MVTTYYEFRTSFIHGKYSLTFAVHYRMALGNKVLSGNLVPSYLTRVKYNHLHFARNLIVRKKLVCCKAIYCWIDLRISENVEAVETKEFRTRRTGVISCREKSR